MSWLCCRSLLPAGAFGPLAATLAYMYVLADRGAVLGCELTDTIIRTLVSDSESTAEGLKYCQ